MEDRVKKLEIITARLMRRTKKVATALITPFPIFGHIFNVGSDDSVLSYMFPCAGTIIKGMAFVGLRPKNGSRLSLRLISGTMEERKDFIIDRNFLEMSSEICVKSGDRLAVTISPIEPGETMADVWVSLLWAPTVRDVVAKSYLIEELERDILEED